VARGEGQRRLGRDAVPARNQDPDQPRRAGALEHRFEVAGEVLVLEVGVGVHDPRQAIRNDEPGQGGETP